MQAQDGKVYANIINNKVAWIFTKDNMPQWNENDLLVVEIPQDLLSLVKVGTEYKNDFVFKDDILTNDNVTYGLLNENNELLYSFTREQRESYGKDEKVVIIPYNQVFEVCNGDLYNYDTKRFNLNIEYVRQLYINSANENYNTAINMLTGENIPLSEMVSWETQEKEAKAYLQSNDIAQASSIALMAQTQGRDLSEFANKIVEKAAKYRLASSFLIGYRQKIIRDLETASDVESIRNIKFDVEFVQNKLESM